MYLFSSFALFFALPQSIHLSFYMPCHHIIQYIVIHLLSPLLLGTHILSQLHIDILAYNLLILNILSSFLTPIYMTHISAYLDIITIAISLSPCDALLPPPRQLSPKYRTHICLSLAQVFTLLPLIYLAVDMYSSSSSFFLLLLLHILIPAQQASQSIIYVVCFYASKALEFQAFLLSAPALSLTLSLTRSLICDS